MNYEEAKKQVAECRASGGRPLREALMIALDKLPTDNSQVWQDEVIDLFRGVQASMFWEIDGLDSSVAYSIPPIGRDASVCRAPAAWLHKLRSVRNSRRDLFDVLRRG